MAAEDELALFETSMPRHQPVTGHARLGRPTVVVSPRCSVAVAYRELAREVEERIRRLVASSAGVETWNLERQKVASAQQRLPASVANASAPAIDMPAACRGVVPLARVVPTRWRGSGGDGPAKALGAHSGVDVAATLERAVSIGDGLRPLPGRRVESAPPQADSPADASAPRRAGRRARRCASSRSSDRAQPRTAAPALRRGRSTRAGTLAARARAAAARARRGRRCRRTHALIAGERRWRAAKLAGLERLPAFVRDDGDGASRLELALIENAAREDLTPVEEARTLHALISDLGVTQAELARRIGRSRADLANTMRLLDLPDDVLELIDDGGLSKGHGKVLLGDEIPTAERCSRGGRASAAGRCANSNE